MSVKKINSIKEEILKLKSYKNGIERNLKEAEDELIRDKAAKRNTYGNDSSKENITKQLFDINKKIEEKEQELFKLKKNL